VTPTCFVDTNVLVYARDASELEKQPAAERRPRLLWATRSGQVLDEVRVVDPFKAGPEEFLGLSRSAPPHRCNPLTE
jgi:hypothetical protein